MRARRLCIASGVLILVAAVCFPSRTEGMPGDQGSTPGADSSVEATDWVEKTLAGFTLEKKVAQIICSDVAGGYISDDDPRLAGWIRLARDLGVGMFVVYGGTPRDVAHLLNRLQGEAAIPILVSADFEGGPGQQVTGASEFPANMAFIRKVIAAKPKGVVAMAYGNPHLIRKIPEVPAFLVGYGERGWFGNQAVYFDSFIKVLKGEIKPSGKLPVKVSERYPIGSGLAE